MSRGPEKLRRAQLVGAVAADGEEDTSRAIKTDSQVDPAGGGCAIAAPVLLAHDAAGR